MKVQVLHENLHFQVVAYIYMDFLVSEEHLKMPVGFCCRSILDIKQQFNIPENFGIFYKINFIICSSQNQSSWMYQFSKKCRQYTHCMSQESQYRSLESPRDAPMCYFRTHTTGCFCNFNKKHLMLDVLKNRCTKKLEWF